jgi:hypothetical protein
MVLYAAMAGCDRESPTSDTSGFSFKPEKIEARHLPNAYRIHPKVDSGGEPAGEVAFEELKRLGFRTK